MRAFFLPIWLLSLFAFDSLCMADEMPEAVRQALNDKLIGSWALDITRGDEKSKGTYAAMWSPGEHSIRIDMTQTGAEGTTRASELLGWDAESDCLTVCGFGADSANWTLRFTDFSSTKWKGTWKGYVNGKADGSPCSMELKGDSFEYRDTTDGKLLVIKATRRLTDESYKEWWKFFKGDWTYEISPSNEKGTATWRIAAKGNALVGRFVAEDGVVGTEIGGWQADMQREMVNGYTSDGGCWSIELTEHSGDEVSGHHYGVLPDGKPFRGRFVGKKVDADHYEWTFTGKDGDGKPLTMTGKYERKKD